MIQFMRLGNETESADFGCFSLKSKYIISNCRHLNNRSEIIDDFAEILKGTFHALISPLLFLN